MQSSNRLVIKCIPIKNVFDPVEVVERNKDVVSYLLLSCELSVCLKKFPDRKEDLQSMTVRNKWHKF